jgi:hypothetical protein
MLEKAFFVRHNRCLFLPVFTVLLLSLLTEAGSCAEAHTRDGWILHQKSKLAGDDVVELVSDGLKITFPRTSMVLISKAPKWDIDVYNQSAKTHYKCPLSKFVGFGRLGFAIAVGFHYANVPLTRTTQITRYLATDVHSYGASPAYLKEMKENLKRDRKLHGMAKSALALTAKSWNLPAQEGLILSRLYGLAELQEPPLKFECIDNEGDKKLGLDTEKVVKSKIADSEFVEPQNYKLVPTMEAVSLDTQGESGLQSLLEGIDANSRKR